MSTTTTTNSQVETNSITPDVNELARSPRPVCVPTQRNSPRKRLFDVAVALPSAIVTMPATIGLAVISSIKFRSAPMFTQPRLGHGGKVFKFWKIRTLPRVTPETADKYQLRTISTPPLARVLRKRHLDELPQLWQVVAGQMSLVGPRPEMPTLSESFDQDFVAERLSVKPGLTGLWQVSVASSGLIGESPEWDLHYVRNRTLRLDTWICYRTILMMTRLSEVQSLDEIPRWTGAAAR